MKNFEEYSAKQRNNIALGKKTQPYIQHFTKINEHYIFFYKNIDSTCLFISQKLKDVAGEAYAMSSGEIDLINSPLFTDAVLQDEGIIFEKMKTLMDSMLLEKYKSISQSTTHFLITKSRCYKLEFIVDAYEKGGFFVSTLHTNIKTNKHCWQDAQIHTKRVLQARKIFCNVFCGKKIFCDCLN